MKKKISLFRKEEEIFVFCWYFFQVPHDAEDKKKEQYENESGGIR